MTHDPIKRLLGEGCSYCSHAFTANELASEFDSMHDHYKSIKCGDCGHKCWVKVDFMGSGHDAAEETELESMIRKVHAEDQA